MLNQQEEAKVRNLLSKFGDLSQAASDVSITQNDVTSIRVLGTVYQNTTGKAMFISVSARSTTVGTGLDAYTDGSNPPTTHMPSSVEYIANNNVTVSFWVLPNNYYKVTMGGTTTLDTWIEWY